MATRDKETRREKENTCSACSFTLSSPNVHAERIVRLPPTSRTHQSTSGSRLLLCRVLVRRCCASDPSSPIAWFCALTSVGDAAPTDITVFHISWLMAELFS